MSTDDAEVAEITDAVSAGSLSVAEVAARLQVSKMTVYRLVHSGDLPAVRVQGSFRVSRAALEEYLRGAYFDAG